jgi:paraquat-inducible protein B
MKEAKVTNKRTFSAIWLLPLIAILIGGWLVYKTYQEKGVMITLQVNDGAGLKAEKTKVFYKGIPVGVVKGLRATEDLKHIILDIEMIKSAKSRLVEDTKFWVVKPSISLTAVTGLDAILTGSYINVVPGNSKKLKTDFIALPEGINYEAIADGMIVNLSSADTMGHKIGEPVIYKKIKVGEVINSTLYDNDKINVKVVIFNKYKRLIDSNTLFWDSSGVKIDAGLSGVKIDMASMETLLVGGIELSTSPNGRKIDENHIFPLYKSKELAMESNNLTVTFKFPIDYGVAVGTKIKFKSVLIGEIIDVSLSENGKFFLAKASIIPKAKNLLTTNSYFWIVSPQIDISGIKNIDTLLKGNYINVIAKEGEKINNFLLHNTPPLTFNDKTGLNLNLIADKLGSIAIGEPILYKQFKVGEVYGVSLDQKTDKALIHIHIYEKYKNLVKKQTKFWEASGVTLKGDLFSGIDVKTQSVSTIIKGGIAFDTNQKYKKTKTVKNNTNFKLYPEYDKEWFDKYTHNLKLILSTDSLGSLSVGSPVLYRQFKVGEISDTELIPNTKQILVNIKIYEPYKRLINSSTKFWNISGITVEGGLFQEVSVKTGSIESIIKGGITFETPFDDAPPIHQGQKFVLYKKMNQDWFTKPDKQGVTLTLSTNKLGSIKKGNPVLYHQFKVGQVTGLKLSPEDKEILVTIRIFEPYKKLVNTSTKFWNVSGVTIEGGLFSGVSVQTGSAEAIVEGGIAFETPDSDAKNIDSNLKFTLYDKVNKEWFNKDSANDLNLLLATDTLNSIKKGNPVLYRQFKVGEVTGTELGFSGQNVLIHIKIYEKYKHLVNSETKFWNASGVVIEGGLLSKMTVQVSSIEALATGGIAFATPDTDEAKKVKNGDSFPLYKRVYKEWLSWDPYLANNLMQQEQNKSE